MVTVSKIKAFIPRIDREDGLEIRNEREMRKLIGREQRKIQKEEKVSEKRRERKKEEKGR